MFCPSNGLNPDPLHPDLSQREAQCLISAPPFFSSLPLSLNQTASLLSPLFSTPLLSFLLLLFHRPSQQAIYSNHSIVFARTSSPFFPLSVTPCDLSVPLGCFLFTPVYSVWLWLTSIPLFSRANLHIWINYSNCWCCIWCGAPSVSHMWLHLTIVSVFFSLTNWK